MTALVLVHQGGTRHAVDVMPGRPSVGRPDPVTTPRGLFMLRLVCCADVGACDCFNCRPIPLTAAHVVAICERFYGIDDNGVAELELMTAAELADQLEYLADYQG